MSRVNLLPPEIRERQRTRKVATLVIFASVGVLLLVVFVYLLEMRSLSSVKSDIDAQGNRNRQLQGRISGLQQYAQLQDQANAEEQLLGQVFAGEVSFSSLLVDLSSVVPSDADLRSLSITVSTTQTPSAGQIPNGIIGSMAFSGDGASSDSVATLLSRLETVKGWANPYVTSVSKAGPVGTAIVQFAGTVDLTTAALTPRGAQGAAALGGP